MLPPETLFAIFPPGAADDTGRVLGFRPVCLAHIAAMEALGVDLNKDIDDSHALIAAWILTQDGASIARVIECGEGNVGAIAAWVEGCAHSPCEIKKAVNAALVLAFSTLIEPEKKNGVEKETVEQTGLGWALELAEWYASEYKMPLDKALVEPLVRVFACIACARQRNGGKHGSPDYYEKHRAKEQVEQLKTLYRMKGGMEHGARCKY